MVSSATDKTPGSWLHIKLEPRHSGVPHLPGWTFAHIWIQIKKQLEENYSKSGRQSGAWSLLELWAFFLVLQIPTNPNTAKHRKRPCFWNFFGCCGMFTLLHCLAIVIQQLLSTNNFPTKDAWWPSSSNDTRIIIILSKVSPRCNFGQTSFSQPGGDTWRLHRGSFSSLSSPLYNYLKPIPKP